MYIVFSIPSPYWKSLHFNKPSLSYKTPYKKISFVVASEKDVLMMPAVVLESSHSFLPSSTFCIASSFFSHILQPLAPGALSREQSWQNLGAIGHDY